MRLYSFVFALSLSLFVGEELAPPVAPNTSIPATIAKGQQSLSTHNLPKPHYPLLCTTTLASLVKGEVLSPEKIRATTGGIASPPSLACTNPSKTALSLSLFVGRGLVCACTASYLHYPLAFRTANVSICIDMLSHPHYPTKTTNTLAF